MQILKNGIHKLVPFNPCINRYIKRYFGRGFSGNKKKMKTKFGY
jgi:hypothetical protein